MDSQSSGRGKPQGQKKKERETTEEPNEKADEEYEKESSHNDSIISEPSTSQQLLPQQNKVGSMNVASKCGPSIGFNQNSPVTIYQTPEILSEEEKTNKIIEEFREKLRKSYLSLPMRHVPWLEKELTTEDHYIDLWLESQNINGKEQRQINMDDLIASINNRKKNIFIEGKPGYGKTSLVYKISKLWTEGKLTSFDLLFVIELRTHNAETIEGFLLNQKLKLNIEQSSQGNFLKAIQNSKVLFVFDGLDEVPVSKKDSNIEFIKEIQNNKNFHILFTSRPTNVIRDFNLVYSEKILIRGFSKDKRNEFVKQYFVIDSEHIQEILEKNNKISQLCESPLMLLLFCILIDKKEDSYELPDSFTDLYKTIVNFVIKRFYDKKARKVGKLDLFETKLSKDNKQIFDIFCKFGEKAFEAIKKNNLIFEPKEIKGDFLFKIGFLISCSSDDTLLEPFHKSFSEFSCALYLYNLFSKDEEMFNEIFPSFLIEVEKEDSLILPFLCGLLKDKSKNILKLIPEWYYYGNWSNSMNLMEECREFLTHEDDLYKLIPPDFHMDVMINDNNQLLTFDNQLKWKVFDREIQNERRDFILNILHNSSQNATTNLDLTKLYFSCGLVILYFPCQSKDICHEKPLSQSQLSVLMEEILKLNPDNISINYPHSDKSMFVLIDRISIQNRELNYLGITNLTLLNEDIIAISHVLQYLRTLFLSTEVNDSSVRDNISPVNVEIQPLIDAMKSPECQLNGLYLSDVFVSENEFKELMDCLSQSKGVVELRIHFTSSSPYVVDLNDLCKEGKQWFNVDLKNIRVIVSKQSHLVINDLFLSKCILTEQDSIDLFSVCEVEYLRCDSQVLKGLCVESPQPIPSSQTLHSLTIKDEIINVSPQIISKFTNLSFLYFDLKEGFQMSSFNKENIIEVLLEKKTVFYLNFFLTFDTKEYLKQIDFIIDLMENIKEKNHSRKISVLGLAFLSQEKCFMTTDIKAINKKESEQLLVHISKIGPYLLNGCLGEFVLSICQSNQGGHYLGPFLNIKNHFSEEQFNIGFEFNRIWGHIIWRITRNQFRSRCSIM